VLLARSTQGIKNIFVLYIAQDIQAAWTAIQFVQFWVFLFGMIRSAW